MSEGLDISTYGTVYKYFFYETINLSSLNFLKDSTNLPQLNSGSTTMEIKNDMRRELNGQFYGVEKIIGVRVIGVSENLLKVKCMRIYKKKPIHCTFKVTFMKFSSSDCRITAVR